MVGCGRTNILHGYQILMEEPMTGVAFNFLEYLNTLEKMMLAWHDHTSQVFRHSTNLGSAREHFIAEVLDKFLPTSVIVGSGEELS
jgi:hypothetical protein